MYIYNIYINIYMYIFRLNNHRKDLNRPNAPQVDQLSKLPNSRC